MRLISWIPCVRRAKEAVRQNLQELVSDAMLRAEDEMEGAMDDMLADYAEQARMDAIYHPSGEIKEFISDRIILSPGIEQRVVGFSSGGFCGGLIDFSHIIPGDSVEVVIAVRVEVEEHGQVTVRPATWERRTFISEALPDVPLEPGTIALGKRPVYTMPEIYAKHGIEVWMKQLTGMPRQAYFEFFRR